MLYRFFIATITGIFVLVSGLAVAQVGPLTSQTLSNPKLTYEAMKRVTQQEPSDGNDGYDIDTCMYTDDYRGSVGQLLFAYLRAIGRNEISMERQLRKAGYPQEVWEAPLRTAISKQVNLVVEIARSGRQIDIAAVKRSLLPDERRIVAALEAYRKAHGSRLPEFDYSRQCGGDWIGFVKLRSSPPGASIRVITDFNFKVCRASGADPYSACADLWTAVGPSTEIPEGTYVYMAQWGSAPAECSRTSFVQSGRASDKPQLKTVERSNRACQQ